MTMMEMMTLALMPFGLLIDLVDAKPLWPPYAPVGEWPQTRMAGVAVVGVMAVAWLLGLLFSVRRLRLARARSQGFVDQEDVEFFDIAYYRFKCWLVGVDSVKLDKKNKTVSVTTQHAISNCCCIPMCEYAQEEHATNGFAEISNRKFKGSDLGGIILAAVFGGLWFHFVPCFWWTCDWGEYDGAGVRGGTWFLGGFLISLVLCCVRCTQRCVVITREDNKRIKIGIDYRVIEPHVLVTKINEIIHKQK